MVWTPAKTSLKRRSLAVVKNYRLNLLAIYLILQCREAFTMVKRFRLSPLMREAVAEFWSTFILLVSKKWIDNTFTWTCVRSPSQERGGKEKKIEQTGKGRKEREAIRNRYPLISRDLKRPMNAQQTQVFIFLQKVGDIVDTLCLVV